MSDFYVFVWLEKVCVVVEIDELWFEFKWVFKVEWWFYCCDCRLIEKDCNDD